LCKNIRRQGRRWEFLLPFGGVLELEPAMRAGIFAFDQLSVERGQEVFFLRSGWQVLCRMV